MNTTTIIIIVTVVLSVISSILVGLYFGGVFGGDDEKGNPSIQEQTFEEPPSIQEQTFEEPPSIQEQTFEEPPSIQEQTFEEPPSIQEPQEMGGYNTVSVTFKGNSGNESFELLVNGKKFKSGKALKTYQTYTTKIKEPVVNVVIRRINDVPADYLTLKDVIVNGISIKKNVNAVEWYPTDLTRRKAVLNGSLYWRGDYIYTTKESPRVNCKVSSWDNWSSCMAGEQKRNRKVIVQPYKGGELCPVLQETRECGNKAVLKMKAEKADTFVDIYGIIRIDNGFKRIKIKEKLPVKTEGDLNHTFYFTEDILEFVIALREWHKGITIERFTYNGKSLNNNFREYNGNVKRSLPYRIGEKTSWQGINHPQYRIISDDIWAHHNNLYIFKI